MLGFRSSFSHYFGSTCLQRYPPNSNNSTSAHIIRQSHLSLHYHNSTTIDQFLIPIIAFSTSTSLSTSTFSLYQFFPTSDSHKDGGGYLCSCFRLHHCFFTVIQLASFFLCNGNAMQCNAKVEGGKAHVALVILLSYSSRHFSCPRMRERGTGERGKMEKTGKEKGEQCMYINSSTNQSITQSISSP